MESIRFIGRHIKKNGLDYFSYSGSGFEFIATPNNGETSHVLITLISELNEHDEQYLAIFINDVFYKKERLPLGEHLIKLDVDKKLRIRIVKCNEAYLSSIYIKDISINDGAIAKPNDKKRPLIGFYGDSLTCGYGLLAKREDDFAMWSEDFTKTYAYLASFSLNMDYTVIARSGISIALPIYVQVTFNDIYDTVDLVDKCDDVEKVDYAVINLGANDCNYLNSNNVKELDEPLNKFYLEFTKLIDLIIKTSKSAKFILCYNMVDIYCPELVDKIYQVEQYIKDKYGNPVKVLKFIPNSDGASSHPSALSHEENAKLLVKTIKKL